VESTTFQEHKSNVFYTHLAEGFHLGELTNAQYPACTVRICVTCDKYAKMRGKMTCTVVSSFFRKALEMKVSKKCFKLTKESWNESRNLRSPSALIAW